MAKVLLVEDDNNLREIYEARLQAEGYEIVSAHDGEEALVLAKQGRPDLIISDVMMPKISGFEMLDILRNTDGLKDVKVIMLTALGQNEDQQRADRLGADRYLVKSQVTLEDIVTVARQLLANPNDPTPAPATAAPASPTPSAAPAPQSIATPQSFVSTPTPAPAAPQAPSAPAPTPTPAAASTPAPAPASPPTPSAPPTPVAPADNEAASEAQTANAGAESESTEAASVETQIEDFVAGATSSPETPAPTPVTPPPATDDNTASQAPPAASPTPIAPTVITPTSTPYQPQPVVIAPQTPTPTAPTATSVNDDKLIAEAVDTLVASTEADAKADAVPIQSPSEAAGNAVTPEPKPAPQIVVTGSVASDAPAEDETAANASTSTPAAPMENMANNGHKKVISPIQSEPKPDLDSLLAAEAAREQGTVPGAVISTPTPAAAPAPTPTPAPQAPAPTAGEQPFDPNSIAL